MTPIKFHRFGNGGKQGANDRMRAAKTMGAIAIIVAGWPLHGNDEASGTRQTATAPTFMASARNELPVAVSDHVELKRSENAFNVLANDTDADGDRLMMVAAIANYGAVAFTREGLLAYAQNPGPARADNIIYTVSDGRGGFAKGVVKIVVQ